MIPYGKQSLSALDIQAVVEALQGDFLTTGPLVNKFEMDLEAEVGSQVVVVSSGTAALHCAYSAIGIQPGDEIVTPPITFIATQATAAILGAKIVFADVQSDTANIAPESVEAAITPRTKAIVAVDFAGHPADIFELKDIANRHGIYLIEDAAHGIGSSYRGNPVGSIADLTTFSFFPTKNMTTGEGGAVSSSNPTLLEKVRKFARQGLVREPEKFLIPNSGPWHQEVHDFGLNYRLPDILCALGSSQLTQLAKFKSRRREIFSFYQQALSGLEWLTVPTERDYVNTNWHLYPIQVPSSNRKQIFSWLRQNDIGVQVNYLPAYQHPVFSNYRINSKEFPNSERFYSREISLPMHVNLTEQDLTKITDLLLGFKFN
jgi:dTDP-4-amino-4,6-dideoxygalactose transaminase